MPWPGSVNTTQIRPKDWEHPSVRQGSRSCHNWLGWGDRAIPAWSEDPLWDKLCEGTRGSFGNVVLCLRISGAQWTFWKLVSIRVMYRWFVLGIGSTIRDTWVSEWGCHEGLIKARALEMCFFKPGWFALFLEGARGTPYLNISEVLITSSWKVWIGNKRRKFLVWDTQKRLLPLFGKAAENRQIGSSKSLINQACYCWLLWPIFTFHP